MGVCMLMSLVCCCCCCGIYKYCSLIFHRGFGKVSGSSCLIRWGSFIFTAMNSAHSVCVCGLSYLLQVFNLIWIKCFRAGVLDDETAKWMSKPRCGVRDRVGAGASARKKRYALQGTNYIYFLSLWNTRECDATIPYRLSFMLVWLTLTQYSHTHTNTLTRNTVKMRESLKRCSESIF